MITRMRVQNFKSLRDVTLDFGPLTVLIGPNDSGKTSILEALARLGTQAKRGTLLGVHNQLVSGGATTGSASGAAPGGDADLVNLVWRHQQERHFQWEVEGRAGGAVFSYQQDLSTQSDIQERLVIDGSTFSSTAAEGLTDTMRRAVLEALETSDRYFFEPRAMRSGAAPEPNPRLSSSGDNLAAVLDALITGPDRRVVLDLERSISENVPTVRGIALRTSPTLPLRSLPDREKIGRFVDSLARLMDEKTALPAAHGPEKVLEFVLTGPDRPPVTVPVTHVSDGVLLVTAYMALAYSDTPEIVLIEEPENGFHPIRLKMIVELMRKMGRGDIGYRPRQIVVTTHSPILLNYLEPDEVRIVHRGDDGATQITPFVNAPDVRKLLEEFAVGELWYLLGEEGLLKGKQK